MTEMKEEKIDRVELEIIEAKRNILNRALSDTEKGCLELGKHIKALVDARACIVWLQGEGLTGEQKEESRRVCKAIGEMIEELVKGGQI